ncbi:MAG: hypothetical protein GEU80_11995 [Dehalococcoidia bacterium]|nr:hypothetical protein [Dehalococcoidia bacterium]
MTTAEPQAQSKPIPRPDEASLEFFEGARRGELMLSRCIACGAWLAPAARICTECLSEDLRWERASGRGVVFTFGVMHQFYHDGFIDELPYNVAVVELEEGLRLNSNIVNVPNEAIRVGMPVAVTFSEQGDGIYLPRFEPAGD